jgi:hypothetical protein
LGSELGKCVGSRVHLVGVPISFEKNFYRLPFTPPSLVRRIGPSKEYPRIDRSFRYASLVAIANAKRCTLIFLGLSPSRPILSTVEPRHRQCRNRATP